MCISIVIDGLQGGQVVYRHFSECMFHSEFTSKVERKEKLWLFDSKHKIFILPHLFGAIMFPIGGLCVHFQPIVVILNDLDYYLTRIPKEVQLYNHMLWHILTNMNIKEIEISEWRDLDKIRALDGSWIFRGQAIDSWSISSSLERTHLTCDNSKIIALNHERFMLWEFIRKAHKISDIKLDTSQIIEWLTIMQHYGCPTRLVDFTRSFYVASYFAIHSKNNSYSDAAVWAFNENWLFENSVSFFEEFNETSKKSMLRDELQDFILINSNAFLLKSHSLIKSDEKFQIRPMLTVVEPFQQIERYARQKSVFIMPTNINVPFEQNLFGIFESGYNSGDYPVKKYIIRNKFFSDLAKELKQMNVTAEVLFPGLDGIAKSISESWTFYNPL